MALVFGRTWDRAELIGFLHARRLAIAAALEGVKAECIQLEARGAIGPLDIAMFRRRAMQLEAELRWHDEFDRILPTLPEPSSRSAEGIVAHGSATEVESTRSVPKPGSRKVGPREPGRETRKREGS